MEARYERHHTPAPGEPARPGPMLFHLLGAAACWITGPAQTLPDLLALDSTGRGDQIGPALDGGAPMSAADDLFAALLDAQDEPDTELEPELPRAGKFYAESVLDPERITAAALAAIHEGQCSTNPETGERHVGVDVGALTAALRESAMQALAPGAGAGMVERRLLASAALLENLIVVWTTNAVRADSIEKLGLYGQLLLKGQNQLRRTLQTLTEIRNPKRATFIKQQNQAVIQQVANSLIAGKTEKSLEFETNKLLETIPDERLEFGTQGAASGIDSQLATVDKVYRPQD